MSRQAERAASARIEIAWSLAILEDAERHEDALYAHAAQVIMTADLRQALARARQRTTDARMDAFLELHDAYMNADEEERNRVERARRAS